MEKIFSVPCILFSPSANELPVNDTLLMKMQTDTVFSGRAVLQVCKPRVTAAQSVMLL